MNINVSADNTEVTESPRDAALESINQLQQNIAKEFVGQSEVVEQVLIALLACGHVLIEGVPGLGKTLLVRCLAASINAQHKRVQFTPDLLPADVTGHAMYDMKTEQFRVRKGPAFTNFLLADEINRAPAKTQAALLEVMQEQQVTIEGKAMEIAGPFMVLATQNPLEHEGTYPLPEAELDRFLMKIYIDYPDLKDEILLTREATSTISNALKIQPVLGCEQMLQLQQTSAELVVDDQLIEYAVRICQATRQHPGLQTGAGPRASIALIRCAKARALLHGNQFVLPDDIKAVALPVLRHRLRLSADMEIDGTSADRLITQLLDTVAAPHQ
jgi:MoxR-like ATPase